MPDILLSIVIPVYNNWNFTRSCLGDLKHLPDNHEVIVVDNGSIDQTQQITELFKNQFKPLLRYIRLDENTGFAHACNIGFAHSAGEYVMFLNNDIRVERDHATWTADILEKAGEAIVGPTVGSLTLNLDFIEEKPYFKESACYQYISGWNITASRKIWNKLVLSEYQGPFTEEFGKAYFEDTDMGFRAMEQGIKMAVIPMPVRHFGKRTSNQLNTLSLYLPAKEKFKDKWKNRIQKISSK